MIFEGVKERPNPRFRESEGRIDAIETCINHLRIGRGCSSTRIRCARAQERTNLEVQHLQSAITRRTNVNVERRRAEALFRFWTAEMDDVFGLKITHRSSNELSRRPGVGPGAERKMRLVRAMRKID